MYDFGDKRLPQRFWEKIQVDAATGCWLWVASLTSNGYGRIRHGEKARLTHRVAYTLLVGDIADGLEIDHLCRSRSCCNPDHLEPVTRRENVLRGNSPQLTKQRHASITECPNGHQYDEQNTYRTVKRNGVPYRRCRKCHAARALTTYHVERAA